MFLEITLILRKKKKNGGGEGERIYLLFIFYTHILIMFALPKLLPDPTHLSIQFRVGTEEMKIKIKVQHKISNQNRIYSSRQHLPVFSELTPARYLASAEILCSVSTL